MSASTIAVTRILIRCDASLTIGSGHVMRCRTLARELRRCGAEVIFLCRRQHGDLINLLESEFPVLPLPEQSLALCDGLEGRDLYRSWLGCTQEQDASECLELLQQAGVNGANWIVVDHYGLDACWEEQLLVGLSGDHACPKLLVIDDLADRTHQADLLLDQNFFGELTHQRYVDLLPPHCGKLLGPDYALLGSEYAQMHPLLVDRTELRRVLVFFGGVDPDNLCGRVMKALLDPALAELSVDVVLGLQSPHRQAIAELVERRPNTTLHEPLPSLAGLIARADLAIGAGGATTWERSCLRLPSLVVAIAENQLPFSQALDQAGHLRLLGDGASVTAEQIRAALVSCMTEQKPEKAFTPLTDGWGAPRMALAMLGPKGPITLRPAVATDEALLLRWANDPQVRFNSFSPEPISSEDHHDWFKKSVVDPKHLLLIATTADGCPIGQIRFVKQPTTVLGDAVEVAVDLSLDRCARGHGLADDLVRLGLQEMEQRWGLTQTVTELSQSDTANNACFVRFDFVSDAELFSGFSPPQAMGS